MDTPIHKCDCVDEMIAELCVEMEELIRGPVADKEIDAKMNFLFSVVKSSFVTGGQRRLANELTKGRGGVS